MFEKLDKIVVTEKDMMKILEWNQQYKDSNEFLGFPLEEGLLIVEQFVKEDKGLQINDTLRQGTYFKINEDSLKIKVYDMKDNVEMMSFDVEIRENDIKYKNFESYLAKRIPKNKIDETMTVALSILIEVFAYMMNVQGEVIEKTETRTVSKKSSSKNKKNKNKIVKITTKKYIFANEDNQDFEKRGYTRQSESWGVRGHWRFYKKTGKKVWVKAHKKGTGENVEAKEYRI